jgi:hypothetical protein
MWIAGNYVSNALDHRVQLLDIYQTLVYVAPLLNLGARDVIQAATMLIATARSVPLGTSLLGPVLTTIVCLRFASPSAFDALVLGSKPLEWMLGHKNELSTEWIAASEALQPVFGGHDLVSWVIRYYMSSEATNPTNRTQSLERQLKETGDNTRRAALNILKAHSDAIRPATFGEHIRTLLSHALMFDERQAAVEPQ